MSLLCPFCRKQPPATPWRPFCSERCRLQDLARWVNGTYRVPGGTVAEPEDRQEEEGDASK